MSNEVACLTQSRPALSDRAREKFCTMLLTLARFPLDVLQATRNINTNSRGKNVDDEFMRAQRRELTVRPCQSASDRRDVANTRPRCDGQGGL